MKKNTLALKNAIISTPSWVMEGTYADNLRFLAGQKTGGVEILCFIYDNETRALLNAEYDTIKQFAKRFAFTLHLPDNLLEEHTALIEQFAPLVRHFIVHPDRNHDKFPAQAALLERLFARFGKEKFALENTGPGCLEKLLALLPDDVYLCMDTGHLLLEGKSPAEYYRRFAPRILEIHLHALDAEAAKVDERLPDHRALKAGEPWLAEFLEAAKDFAGIVNLEVFSWAEAAQSLNVLEEVNE
jgi:sugar phosphate isomerase/epimerase